MKALLLLLAASTIAVAAPRKLWTWDPGEQWTETTNTFRAILSYKSDAQGNTVIVFGEAKMPNGMPGSEGIQESSNYRILWIGSRGNVIADQKVASTDYAARTLNPDSPRGWTALSVSATTAVVGQADFVRTLTLKGRTLSFSDRLPSGQGQVDYLPTSFQGFSGWFERNSFTGTTMPDLSEYPPKQIPAMALFSLSLWSEK